jgi:hypothetical protein
MRSVLLALAASFALAAGCAEPEDAVLEYTVTDATPAVPIRAMQVFELDGQDRLIGFIAFIWGGRVVMPDRGSITYLDEVPAPFRVCAVALGEEEGQWFHALGGPVQPIVDQVVSVTLTLEAVDSGGEVPAPCGPEIAPWPEGV